MISNLTRSEGRCLRINVYAIGVIIILLAFLEPDYFTSIPALHFIFYLMRLIGIFIAILICVKLRQFLYVTLFVCLYYVIYFYATYLQGGSYNLLVSHAILTVGFVMWLEILLRNKPNIALHSLNIIYSVLVYVNIIFFLLFPDGYTGSGNSTRYFLGVTNQFAATLIPAVIISVMYSMARFNKIVLSTKLLIAAVFFSFAYFWSATSIVGISLIIIYLLLVHKGWLKSLINYKTVALSILFLFFTVVYFNNLHVFAFVIEDVLGKDLTLSTRTVIWDEAKIMISESPLFGYGTIEGNRYIYFNEWNQKDAHNMVLHILLQSGFFGLSVIILLVLLMFKRVTKYKVHPLSRFILFSLFVTTTMMLSEVYAFRFLYLVMLLGIFCPNIIQADYKKKVKIFTLERKIYSSMEKAF